MAVVKGSLLSKQEKKTEGAPPPGDISVPPPFSPPSIPYIVYQTVKARRRKGKMAGHCICGQRLWRNDQNIPVTIYAFLKNTFLFLCQKILFKRLDHMFFGMKKMLVQMHLFVESKPSRRPIPSGPLLLLFSSLHPLYLPGPEKVGPTKKKHYKNGAPSFLSFGVFPASHPGRTLSLNKQGKGEM